MTIKPDGNSLVSLAICLKCRENIRDYLILSSELTFIQIKKSIGNDKKLVYKLLENKTILAKKNTRLQRILAS